MNHLALAAALAAAFPAIAAAQPAADPASPAAPVPAPAYRSVFQDLPAGVAQEPLDWKQANADVARFPRGHADYLKWEQQQRSPAGSAAPAGAPQPAGAPAGRAPRPQGQQHH